MQDKERGKAGEDRLKREKDCSVGGRKMLLGPALNGKGRGGGEQAGDGECDQEPRGDAQVRSSAERESDCHKRRGYSDLEGGELAGGDLR